MQCPECFTHLGDAPRCACGWVKPAPAGGYHVAGEARPICRTVGCSQHAMNGFAHCKACEERLATEAAQRACEARGLKTVDQQRAYVRSLLRKGFQQPPSFERWANTITQGAVDFLVRSDGRDDQRVLDRLRVMGVIDEHNKLIPHEKRAEVRAALEAKRLAAQRELEERLKAQGVVRRPEPEVQS